MVIAEIRVVWFFSPLSFHENIEKKPEIIREYMISCCGANLFIWNGPIRNHPGFEERRNEKNVFPQEIGNFKREREQIDLTDSIRQSRCTKSNEKYMCTLRVR